MNSIMGISYWSRFTIQGDVEIENRGIRKTGVEVVDVIRALVLVVWVASAWVRTL